MIWTIYYKLLGKIHYYFYVLYIFVSVSITSILVKYEWVQRPEEFTKVRNITKIELGRYETDTWYFSFIAGFNSWWYLQGCHRGSLSSNTTLEMYFIVLKLKTIYLDLCLPAYFELCLLVLLFCYSFSDNFSLFLADVNSLSLLSCKDLCIYPLYFDIIVVVQVIFIWYVRLSSESWFFIVIL